MLLANKEFLNTQLDLIKSFKAKENCYRNLQKINSSLCRVQTFEGFAFKVQNNIAIMNINGFITKEFSIWTWFFGGTSLDVVSLALKELESRDDIKKIIMSFNSGGGESVYCHEIANQIRGITKTKPIVAAVNTFCCSAAYWLASACSSIYSVAKLTTTGSIGAVFTHVSVEEKNIKDGIQVTEITSSEFKASGSSSKNLTNEEKQMLQSKVDEVNSLFQDDILKFRSKKINSKILNNLKGRVFMAKEAIENGLVDSVKSMNSLLSNVNDDDVESTEEEEDDVESTEEEDDETESEEEEDDVESTEEEDDVESTEEEDDKKTTSKLSSKAIKSIRKKGIVSERKRVMGILSNMQPENAKYALSAIKKGTTINSFNSAELKRVRSSAKKTTGLTSSGMINGSNVIKPVSQKIGGQETDFITSLVSMIPQDKRKDNK